MPINSNTLSPFQYGDQEIRTVTVDGEARIVVADIARLLGYRDAANAARLLRDHHKGYSEVSTPSGLQNMLTTNEAGFNRLVLRSNAANAESIQDWMTDAVMPAIRRTGSYTAPEAPELLVARALIEAAGLLEVSKQQVAELTPRAEAWDELASATGDYEVGDAAKILARAGVETGRQRLFDQLKDLGWIYRGPQGKWKARQTAVDMGYLTEKPQSHHHPRTGEVVLDAPQVRVAVKGLERLRVRLGVLSIVEAS